MYHSYSKETQIYMQVYISFDYDLNVVLVQIDK